MSLEPVGSGADTAAVPVLKGIGGLVGAYDAILSDVWGVIHNGVEAFIPACDALCRARTGGARVVLVSNAPRPAAAVQAQLDVLGVPRAAYDGIVTSGDVTRATLEGQPGLKVFHLGPDRDRPVFEGLDLDLVAAPEAELILNTGLFDDTAETPDDYRALLERFRTRGLRMICANPDIVVERGTELVWCAGALAELYETLGGEVVWAGKPHGPIYEVAFRMLESLSGGAVDKRRVIVIGDSVRTDLAGAARAGLDAVFIAEGIHGAEAGRGAELDEQILETMFREAGLTPRAALPRLAW